MSTRSLIGRQFSNKTIRAIYCHSDGYLSHNGLLLLNSYTDPDKINQLINLGDISSLAEEIGRKHPFDAWKLKKEDINPDWATWTRAYGRDRGEKDVMAKQYMSLDSYLSADRGQEFMYLFCDDVWYYTEDADTPMVPLTMEACAKED